MECISTFVQQNFTGPKLPQDLCDFLESSLFADTDFRQLLTVNNEEINVNTDYPALLVAARCVFQNCDFNNLLNLWWCWRCLIIHQKILDDLSPSLLSQADRLLKEMENLPIGIILL